MANYTKLTNFASKDSLASGNPLKIIKGTEIDDEFEALETSITTKADTASPTFTGTPTAPTAGSTTNTSQIATTAFVQAQKVSPAFTGTPTAPTAAASDDSTQLATTAFVQDQKASPAFTGTPTAPTATTGTNTTQVATTEFVQQEIGGIKDYVKGFAVFNPTTGVIYQKTANMSISFPNNSSATVTLTGFSDNNYGVLGTAHGSDTAYNVGRWVGVFDKSSSGFTATFLYAYNSQQPTTFVTLMILDGA
jgi:hypothetical protein